MNKVRLACQLMEDEGVRLKPYRCTAGKLTIGVGRNLDDRGITQPEALGLLDNDIDDFWANLQTALPWVAGQPEPVQEALVNMAFNLGVPGLLQFKNTLSLIQQGRYADAADEMIKSRWATQVGARARRLAAMVRSA